MEIAISLIDVFAMLSFVFRLFVVYFVIQNFILSLCRHMYQSFMTFVFWVMVLKAFPNLSL